MRYLKSCILHDVNISRERKVYIESIPYRKQARSPIFITILLSDLNVKFANNVIMFLIWRFVKFSNVSDIFLAFKYVWNILTAPFVARRVFLHLFLSRFFWIQPRPLWQTVQARGDHREGSLTCSTEMVITWRLSFRNVSMLVCCHNDHT